ncbi:aspartic peptidase domain-containing protein [Vararia minispora EC-137]|uniref:Aspartic peptidase domain-containing protein n=1 Tax=Vararia minispora EC-137 TaxID=1314806 RepID=A0ACB8QLT6_9AGAM|nr:aspartic peptidase domain-containing protein [Vararia minispora EC-137]
MSTKSVRFAANVAETGARQILARDRARAQKFLAGIQPHGPVAFHTQELRRRRHHHKHTGGTTGGAGSDPTTGGGAVTYTTQVGVGNPATQYTLLIDTGSSNTWVGANKRYTQTSTSKNTGNRVNVGYGSGQFSGTEYTDQVSLSSDLVIQNQSIGVASSARGFTDVDGILGIGPVDLTQGTVSSTGSVPTVTDNLFRQGTIPTESIGISYVPTTSSSEIANGELDFGGVDTAKTSGDVTFVPITSTSPASNYWGIDQTVSYNGQQILNSAGIVDTGTTLVLIATDAFQKYQKATGATLDQTTGLLTLTEAQFSNLQPLVFTVGGTQFALSANAQIWPRSLNSQLGGEAGKIYLVVSDLGNNSGQGLDFINGFTFLQRFYSIYDTTNSQVGLAPTPFTDAETN